MSGFELRMIVPGDARFCEAVREVASQAAQHVGCPQERAAQFGADVEQALRGCVEEAPVPVTAVFRQVDEELEVVLTPSGESRLARTLRIDV